MPSRLKILTPPRSELIAILAAVVSVGCIYSDADDDDRTERAATAPLPTAQASVESPAKVESGKQLLQEGKHEEAIDAFTEALKDARESNLLAQANQDEAEVYFQRGLAYLRSGFPDTAVQDFNAAINLLPSHGNMYEQRARAYVELGDSYNAMRDATQAIRLSPDNWDAYHIRGQVYLGREQYDRAVADLEQALEKKPDLAETIHPQLAEAYAKWSGQLIAAGNPAAAEEKLAKARAIDPMVDGNASVVAVPDPAVTAEPVEQTVAKPILEDAERKFQQGRGHQLAKAYDQAIIEYTEAIALQPDYRDAYLRRGETLLLLGFPDTALEDLRRAAHRGATSAEAHRLEAQAHMALDNPHRAALSATEALHADPSDASTYALRGEAYLQLENWDRAVADLDEAIRRNPSLRPSLEAKLATARRRQLEADKPELQASTAR
jgi:tetratricopeptide (TPR) repeat protein